MNGSRCSFPPAGQLVDQILRRRCGTSGHHLDNSHPVSRLEGCFGESQATLTRVSASCSCSQVASRDGSSEDPLAGDADTLRSELLPS